MTGPLRLAIVATHPIQHFCPLYRELAKDPRVELRVYFASRLGAAPYFDPGFGREVSWGEEVTTGFEHDFLTDEGGTIEQGAKAARVGEALRSFSPDVVQVYGYGDRLARRSLLWCLAHRTPAVMVSDSELRSSRSTLRRVVKQLAVRAALRIPAGFLTIGDENERYYRFFGVTEERLRRSPIPIDTPMLDAAMREAGARRRETRSQWQVSEDEVVLLAVGKSVPRKRHLDIIESMGLLNEGQRSCATVVLAGGGEQTELLVERARQLKVRVLPLGFVPPSKLPDAYLGADVLVHPSEADPHPLAIAEAVYTGLPIVVSDRVGSWGPSDDVRPVNGERVPVGDIHAYAKVLGELLGDSARRERASAASLEIGRQRTLEESARTFVDGVLALL